MDTYNYDGTVYVYDPKLAAKIKKETGFDYWGWRLPTKQEKTQLK